MTGQPITGSSSITLDSVKLEAVPPYTYLGVAENMMPGVRVLSSASSLCAHTLAFVTGHVLECLLKAYLSKNGSDSLLKGPEIRHNLNTLWEMASAAGLGIEKSSPSWVVHLSNLHNTPYYLRYSEKIHGLVPPEAEPMLSVLESLLTAVKAGLAKHST